MSATAALREAATGTAVAKKEAPKDFPAMLTVWKGEIARALPKHLNADRMARIALTCFRNTPKLGECDPKSVFAAVIQAAQLGIEPGLMGEAHLIPFKDTCQLIPGYQGLIKLAKQTGQVVDIYAMAVREKDKFACTFGLNRTLEHSPLASKGGFPATEAERGEIIGFYAVAVFKDGTRTFVLMGKDAIDRVRDGSQGYQMAKRFNKLEKSPWTSHYEEMGNKTVIRRLCKLLPKSPELAQAIALDEAHHRGQDQGINLTEALDGSYAAPANNEEPIDIDPSTGEVIEKATPPAPAGSAPASPSSSGGTTTGAPAAPSKPPLFTMKDALRLINKGEYGEARDLVKEKCFTDNDRAECEACIKKHEAGEKV
jgi:recombination protein RecT